MSGRRCKALREKFYRMHGRYPYRASMSRKTFKESCEWRELKKAYLQGRRNP